MSDTNRRVRAFDLPSTFIGAAPESSMTSNDEWVRERATLVSKWSQYQFWSSGIMTATKQNIERLQDDVAAALQEAIERGKAEGNPYVLDHIATTNWQSGYKAAMADVIARLESPDEALVEAARHAWMNRDLSDPDSEPLRDTIRALARALKESPDDQT